MKKLIVLAIMATGSLNLFAQGTVVFGNVAAGKAVTSSRTGQPLPVGTAYKVALYWLPDNGTNIVSGNQVVWTSTDAPTTAVFDAVLATPNAGNEYIDILLPSVGFSSPGFFSGGVRSAPIAGASFAWFQVRAWETAYGATYEAARDSGRDALIGTSNIFRSKTGDPVNAVPAVNLATTALQGFVVAPVPEPSVLGLGILGVGALLLLRRRS